MKFGIRTFAFAAVASGLVIGSVAQAAWMPFEGFESYCAFHIRNAVEKKGLADFRSVVKDMKKQKLKPGEYTTGGTEHWREIRGLKPAAFFTFEYDPYQYPGIESQIESNKPTQLLSYVRVAFPRSATNGGQSGFVYLVKTKVRLQKLSVWTTPPEADRYEVEVDPKAPWKSCISSIEQAPVIPSRELETFLDGTAHRERSAVSSFLAREENKVATLPDNSGNSKAAPSIQR